MLWLDLMPEHAVLGCTGILPGVVVVPSDRVDRSTCEIDSVVSCWLILSWFLG